MCRIFFLSCRCFGPVDEFNEDLIGSFFLQEAFSAFSSAKNITIMGSMEKTFYPGIGRKAQLIELLSSCAAAGYPDNSAYAAFGGMGDGNYHKNHLLISVMISICCGKCAEPQSSSESEMM